MVRIGTLPLLYTKLTTKLTTLNEPATYNSEGSILFYSTPLYTMQSTHLCNSESRTIITAPQPHHFVHPLLSTRQCATAIATYRLSIYLLHRLANSIPRYCSHLVNLNHRIISLNQDNQNQILKTVNRIPIYFSHSLKCFSPPSKTYL